MGADLFVHELAHGVAHREVNIGPLDHSGSLDSVVSSHIVFSDYAADRRPRPTGLSPASENVVCMSDPAVSASTFGMGDVRLGA